MDCKHKANSHDIDVVIKLGGSAISVKDKLETVNEMGLQQAGVLVKKFVDAGLCCVVVHGAGSFGHHQAKQYQVTAGLKDQTGELRERTKLGFCLTHQSVRKLNGLVLESLVKEGVHAVACSPCDSWQTRERKVEQDGVAYIRHLLELGFVPVLHGDCVLDSALQCTILSGDTIIKTLCQTLRVACVVFLTDVAGVYDRPPSEEGAVLLQELTLVSSTGHLARSVTTALSGHDVTGGMELKLETARTVASTGALVRICCVDTPMEQLYDPHKNSWCCLGTVGTTIRLDSMKTRDSGDDGS